MRVTFSIALSLALSSALAGCLGPSSRSEKELTEERDRLLAEKKRLEQELRDAISVFPPPPSQLNEDVEVVVAVPNTLIQEILTRTVAEGIDGMALRIRNLKLHVEKDLKTKLLVAKPTLGELELDLLLLDVTGVIAAGTPEVSVGDGRIRLEVALTILRGQGQVRIRFRWRGRGLAKSVCGNLDVTRDVAGSLVPLTLHFRGSALLRVEESQFVLNPAVPQQRFQLVVEPSQASWASFQEVLSKQSDACRFALKKIDVERRLRELLERGFTITVHTERLKTVRLPLVVTEQVPIEDRKLELTASPVALKIGDQYTWFGVNLEASRVEALP